MNDLIAVLQAVGTPVLLLGLGALLFAYAAKVMRGSPPNGDGTGRGQYDDAE